MKGITPNNIHIDDQVHRPRKNTQNSSVDIPLINESPKSTNSNPDFKFCTFERDRAGYGFKITGNAPVKVQAVRPDGVAWASGLRENDIIIMVNGTAVSEKQHKDVVALIRKENRVELQVQSDTSNTISTTTNSSTRPNLSSPTVTRIPKIDPNIIRPNSIPKVIPRHKNSSESQIHKPNKYQSIERNNNIPTKIKKSTKNDDNGRSHLSPESSSECSISTSSVDSEYAKRLPTRPPHTGITSPTQSDNGIPIKSNSYNIPNSLTSTKHASLQKIQPREQKKNKTIPGDGVKSYDQTLIVDTYPRSQLQPSYSTLPKKKNAGLFLGREFDDDNKDDDESENSHSVIDMLSSVKDALSKPCLVAILLNYVKENLDDMKILILYYTCKLYRSLALRRDFLPEAPRMANEIITTFLLEKSPLYVIFTVDIINETLRIFKAGETLAILFDQILEVIFEVLKIIVDDVRGKLTRGIQLSEDMSTLVNTINSTINQEKEMSLLQRTMCNIFNKSQKDSNFSDSVIATHIGLATMYQYFHRSNFLPGASIRARSTDSINNLTVQSKIPVISELFKVNTFCSTYQPKLSLGLRKKSKSVNGHVLIEAACLHPEECAICEGLLWGTSPQGFFCTMCTNYYHILCKKKIKTTCSRKLRKSNSQVTKEEKPAFFGRLSRKSSTNSIRNVNMVGSGDNVTNVGSSHFFNNANLIPDDKTRRFRLVYRRRNTILVSIFSQGSVFLDGNGELSKSQSEDQLNRINSTNFERFGSVYDLNGSLIPQSSDNDTNVVIQELVTDDSMSDPDMKVAESFDAFTEINSVFPHVNSECDTKRLIVLLEFYHKTRYILMNLKRFLYSLVLKWPPTQYLYYKALSLDCIGPFVNLIKSLVLTIEKCIKDQDFIGLELAVLDWLSDNNDDRLKEWVSLSSNLCCTNSLNIVKQMKQTTLRAVVELIPLMNAKVHKLIIIEELTQIRPLLISLPLIVKNIIKCLTKQEEKYSDELLVWKEVSIKMDYLCEYIDRCCIPLVDWINNGSIFRKAEKFEFQNKSIDCEKEIRDFCLDFPRTLFHFPIFDFQYAKIMTWSTNTKKMGVEIQSAYLKKGTDVLLIFYKTFIVVLQKENDHYVLKPIKPLRNLFDKQAPIIDLSNGIIVKNGGQEENHFILNIISHKRNDALLLRIGFSRLEVVESWMEYIDTKSYNLGKSIALFKNNDLRTMPDNLSYFERSASTVSGKSKASHESFYNSILGSINSEIEEKEGKENIDAAYTSLSETLMKASETLDQNQSLYTLFNVTEDTLPNHIKTMENKGPKSLDELTLVFYTLSQALIHESQRLVLQRSDKVSEKVNLEGICNMLDSTCKIVNKWNQCTNSGGEIQSKVVLRSSLEPNSDNTTTKHIEKIQLVKNSTDEIDGSQKTSIVDGVKLTQSSQCDVTDAVSDIVHEIIEEAINQVKRRSYKYVPTDSLLPSFSDDDHIFLSKTVLTPNNSHLNSPLDETVTVSRAQITLHHKTFFPGATDKH